MLLLYAFVSLKYVTHHNFLSFLTFLVFLVDLFFPLAFLWTLNVKYTSFFSLPYWMGVHFDFWCHIEEETKKKIHLFLHVFSCWLDAGSFKYLFHGTFIECCFVWTFFIYYSLLLWILCVHSWKVIFLSLLQLQSMMIERNI